MPIPKHLRAELLGSQDDTLPEALTGQSCFNVGDTVKAADRDNYGHVVAVNGDKISVHFVNPKTGKERTKHFSPDQIAKTQPPRTNLSSATSKPNTPTPLVRELPPSAPFPLDALGDVLGPAALAIHETIRAPLAMCCQSVLAAAALASQPHGDIHIDGRVIPLSCFFLSVGSTGERKSATDSEALRAHYAFEEELSRTYGRDYHEFEIASSSWKKERDERLKKAKGLVAKKSALSELGPCPVPPLSPVMMATEPSFPGLVKLMLISRPSMGVFSDEAGTFISGNAMSEDNRRMTAAGLSSLWDGKAFKRVRAEDGASILRGRRLSIHLMAQPNIASSLFADPTILEQGLMSRFLVSWPESTVGTRLYSCNNLSADDRMVKYRQGMQELLEKPISHNRFQPQELEPPALKLSSEAKAMWVKFHDATEGQLASDGGLNTIRGFGNKVPEHALRLAGILHLVNDPGSLEVSVDIVAAGIDLAQYYATEALRVFDAPATSIDLELAGKLLKWVGDKDRVALHQIYQRGPNAIRDAKTARTCATILEDHGWLQKIEGGMEIDGGHRKEVWDVCSRVV